MRKDGDVGDSLSGGGSVGLWAWKSTALVAHTRVLPVLVFLEGGLAILDRAPPPRESATRNIFLLAWTKVFTVLNM